MEVEVAMTINKGENGYPADPATAVPVMYLKGNSSATPIRLGSFPPFSLSFSMNSPLYTLDFDPYKGVPAPNIEMLINSTIPIDDEEVGLAIVVGAQSNLLTMRAILPPEKEIGISDLITLANNENVLAIMPSNIPVVYDFFLKDFEISFDTELVALKIVNIEVATREVFTWSIIPGLVTLESINLADRKRVV